MRPQYWDTSALLKLYTHESDTNYIIDLAAKEAQPICTSIIATLEVLSALHRKQRAGEVPPDEARQDMLDFETDCAEGRVTRLPCGDEMVAQAREVMELARTQPRNIMIRSLDAIHVASALSIRAGSLVATDGRLREVAALAGLKLIPKG